MLSPEELETVASELLKVSTARGETTTGEAQDERSHLESQRRELVTRLCAELQAAAVAMRARYATREFQPGQRNCGDATTQASGNCEVIVRYPIIDERLVHLGAQNVLLQGQLAALKAALETAEATIAKQSLESSGRDVAASMAAARAASERTTTITLRAEVDLLSADIAQLRSGLHHERARREEAEEALRAERAQWNAERLAGSPRPAVRPNGDGTEEVLKLRRELHKVQEELEVALYLNRTRSIEPASATYRTLTAELVSQRDEISSAKQLLNEALKTLRPADASSLSLQAANDIEGSGLADKARAVLRAASMSCDRH
jgi:hypothetical protein